MGKFGDYHLDSANRKFYTPAVQRPSRACCAGAADRGETVREVAHMIWEWEDKGDELYSDFAERLVTYFEGRASATSCAKDSI